MRVEVAKKQQFIDSYETNIAVMAHDIEMRCKAQIDVRDREMIRRFSAVTVDDLAPLEATIPAFEHIPVSSRRLIRVVCKAHLVNKLGEENLKKNNSK